MNEMIDELERDAAGGPRGPGGASTPLNAGTDEDAGSSVGGTESDTQSGSSGVRSPRDGRVAGPSKVRVGDATLRVCTSEDALARHIKDALGAFMKIKTSLQRSHDRDKPSLDPDDSVPLVAPGGVQDKGPAMEVCARIARRLKWSAVACDSRYTFGGLELTAMGSALIEAATTPNPSTPGVINPRKAPLLDGFVATIPQIAQAVKQACHESVTDIRELALKVAFLDMQRERFYQSR